MPTKKEKTTELEEKTQAATAAPKGSYILAVGRRKRAVACVKMYKKGQGNVLVNEKDYKNYFSYFEYQNIVTDPLAAVNQKTNFDWQVKVAGGGPKAQAEATRLGVARALEKFNPDFRPALKKRGFLRMDARKKERKKPGLKRARRAPQWNKR